MSNWRQTRRRKFVHNGTHSRYGADASKSLKNSKRLMLFAKLSILGVVGLFILSFIVIPLLAFNLPSPDKIVRRDGFSTKILDRNGEVLYDIFADQKRTPVDINDFPDFLKKATVAIEDKNFYSHDGFDPLGMVRGFSRFFTRGRAQGGSTLTQQLVKNVLLTNERSVWRKVREFVLAIQIERKFSKDEILQMYLNEAPYGGTAWGVGAAAETYFGKEVKDLNLVESAILAGLPQRPSYYSPYSSNPDAYLVRTENVLRRMREDGYITSEQEEEAKKQLAEFEFQARDASFKAPHFVLYVQELLEERYGQKIVEQGGLKVTTTLDLKLQEEAQKIVKEEIDKAKNLDIGNGAAVVIDPQTGELLAMVGSKDFSADDYDGQVNVTRSLRQPGSAIKPITYVTALKEGYTPSTLIMDVATKFPGGAGQPDYEPKNYDGKFRGPVQLRYALGNSLNIPAVKVLSLVGVKDMLSTAYDLGITSLEPTSETLSRVGLSVTLGGGEVRLLELTSAYGAFTNQGFKVEPTSILKVEDNEGKVMEENKPEKGKRVLTPEQAFLMADILSDNTAREAVFGANSLLRIPGRTVAVKTGTTNDRRDNWAIGGNTQAIVGVWVGNNDNSEMKQVASGVSGASPIWRRIVLTALDGKPNIGFEQPGGIVTASVDVVSGYASHDGYPSRIEKFVDGTQPGEDVVHVKLKVCKNDGKLATPSDISSGNYDEKEYFVFKEEDPFEGGSWTNHWQEGILSWILTQTDVRYKPPTDYCGSTNPVSVDFDNPRNEASNLPNEFEVKIRAESTSDIHEVELFIDGTSTITFTSPPYTYRVNLSNGIHKLKAKARDENGRESEREITIGVNTAANPTATPEPTSTPIIELP